jgi:dipeptidyl-peptidase-4
VFGWSYGGFLAARAVLDADTPFAAAVAVAPVSDWTLYDTAYTERYLGLPKLPDGSLSPLYRDSSLLPRAGLLARPLLLMHGTADDNVLFENSLRLIEALESQERLFDLAIYPGKAHGIGGRAAQLHLHRTMDAFFDRTLRGTPP